VQENQAGKLIVQENTLYTLYFITFLQTHYVGKRNAEFFLFLNSSESVSVVKGSTFLFWIKVGDSRLSFSRSSRKSNKKDTEGCTLPYVNYGTVN
jgi:hypothetical protein